MLQNGDWIFKICYNMMIHFSWCAHLFSRISSLSILVVDLRAILLAAYLLGNVAKWKDHKRRLKTMYCYKHMNPSKLPHYKIYQNAVLKAGMGELIKNIVHCIQGNGPRKIQAPPRLHFHPDRLQAQTICPLDIWRRMAGNDNVTRIASSSSMVVWTSFYSGIGPKTVQVSMMLWTYTLGNVRFDWNLYGVALTTSLLQNEVPSCSPSCTLGNL